MPIVGLMLELRCFNVMQNRPGVAFMKTLHVIIVAIAAVAASALLSNPNAQSPVTTSSISAAGKDAAWVTIGQSVWYCTTLQNKCQSLDLVN